MNFYVPLLICAFTICIEYVCALDPYTELFRYFIKKHSKSYSEDEYLYRFENFKNSLHRIKKKKCTATSLGDSVRYGITKFSDYSAEEFKKFVLHSSEKSLKKKNRKSYKSHITKRSVVNVALPNGLPNFIDWRDADVITAIKNQENCGACWAFSTVETMESMKAMKTDNLEELSVQQLIDCADGGNFGCNGGDTCSVLKWMNDSGVGLTTEKDYPLTNVQAKCRQVTSYTAKLMKNFTCSQYIGNEQEMIRFLALHGPIVSAVDATLWQDYLGGVIQYHCDDQLNHAVQIVGYNYTGPVPYYIVRNSWGPEFGLDGYLHIAIGRNLCGIAERVTTMDVE